MIPRFEPILRIKEFFSIFKGNKNSIGIFEKKFSEKFNAKESIAFPYGRTALFFFFKALKLKNIEVIVPSYTCSVVPHAIHLSGNIPVLVDIGNDNFNMDLKILEKSITQKTTVIIATHLFGYPMDMSKLIKIKEKAEKKYNKKIWLINDCAHSFGVRWNSTPVSEFGDISLYGLNISKLITTVYGGMLSFNDNKVAKIVRENWDNCKVKPSIIKLIYRKIYALLCFLIFKKNFYWFICWLQNNTKLLYKITNSYHLDDKISFPKDYLNEMLPFEAEIGINQLDAYDSIISERRKIAGIYHNYFKRFPGWVFPSFDIESTFSHYTVLVPEREKVVNSFLKNKIELGILIQYSIDELKSYKYLNQHCPNSIKASLHSINLPLTKVALKKFIEKKYIKYGPII